MLGPCNCVVFFQYLVSILVLEKRDIVVLFLLCSECQVAVVVLGLFLAVQCVGLWRVIVAFHGHSIYVLFELRCKVAQYV